MLQLDKSGCTCQAQDSGVGGFHGHRGTPKWMVYFMEPLKWMIWRYPHFWKPPVENRLRRKGYSGGFKMYPPASTQTAMEIYACFLFRNRSTHDWFSTSVLDTGEWYFFEPEISEGNTTKNRHSVDDFAAADVLHFSWLYPYPISGVPKFDPSPDSSCFSARVGQRTPSQEFQDCKEIEDFCWVLAAVWIIAWYSHGLLQLQ